MEGQRRAKQMILISWSLPVWCGEADKRRDRSNMYVKGLYRSGATLVTCPILGKLFFLYLPND